MDDLQVLSKQMGVSIRAVKRWQGYTRAGDAERELVEERLRGLCPSVADTTIREIVGGILKAAEYQLLAQLALKEKT